jgi:hypothetical protein
MNSHIITPARRLVAPARITIDRSGPNTRRVRAWLKEPPRRRPLATTAHMYGLLLRPSERADTGRQR